MQSGFRNQDEEKKFEKEGVTIYKMMFSELGNYYQIKYFSILHGKLFDSLNDFEL